MKKVFIFLVAFSVLLTSCEDFDPTYDGFELNFWNKTSEFYNAEIIIGGFNNGKFIATDSVVVKEIEIGGNNALLYFVNENRWKPDLNKIRKIPSERCYFKIKLSNGREELITKFNSSELFDLQVLNKNYFKGDSGLLIITINNSIITGRAVVEE